MEASTYDIYCGGKFVKGSIELRVTNKYSGEIYAKTWQADAGLLDKALNAANDAKEICAGLSSFEKYNALTFISKEIEKDKDRLATVLSVESGKPFIYAVAEVERAIQTFLVAAEESKRPPGEYLKLDWTKSGLNREGLVRYFPIGIIAGISPFNFPLNLAVHKIAPAIACGCPIVLKPASSTPLSTLELARIIDKSGLPPGAVSILPMDRKTGNLLATDQRPVLLSFTGSPDVGWELKKQSGRKKVVLELGGNAGVIISNIGAPDQIIEKCMTGAFAYSGQICIHAQRFYVHPEIFDEFISQMKHATGKLKCGDPVSPATRLSKMIDEENAVRVETWVNEALDGGAKLVYGGKREGAFYPATILTGTKPNMKVNSEEVFGPVICVEKYSGDIADAVKLINDTRFGLQCGVYTDSVKELDYIFSHVEAGGIIHNEMPTLRFDHMPYGGVKDSGLGREGVRYSMMDMLEPRILVK